MSQFHALITLSVVAAGVIAAERFVNTADAQAGDGANTWGVARAPAAAAGEVIPVDAAGTAIVTSGAAFAKGALLQSDANGKAITKAAGVGVARALKAASGADQRIEVVLIPN